MYTNENTQRKRQRMADGVEMEGCAQKNILSVSKRFIGVTIDTIYNKTDKRAVIKSYAYYFFMGIY